jgi:hypothetical protein
MSAGAGEQWGGGRRVRRRSQLLESFSGAIPWSELQRFAMQDVRRTAHPIPVYQCPASPESDMLRGISQGSAAQGLAPEVAA